MSQTCPGTPTKSPRPNAPRVTTPTGRRLNFDLVKSALPPVVYIPPNGATTITHISDSTTPQRWPTPSPPPSATEQTPPPAPKHRRLTDLMGETVKQPTKTDSSYEIVLLPPQTEQSG